MEAVTSAGKYTPVEYRHFRNALLAILHTSLAFMFISYRNVSILTDYIEKSEIISPRTLLNTPHIEKY